MKKLFAVFAFVSIVGAVFAQTPKKPEITSLSWMTLQDAQLSYEQGDFGEAVRLVDTAKSKRRDEVAWSLYVLNQALNPSAVQVVGDNIDAVVEVLKERNAEDALTVIHDVLVKRSQEELNYSIAKLVKTVALYEEYPEADFMLGKLYMLEGEYVLADAFLTRAWEHADILDIPDQRFDILYQMAYLAKLQKDYEKFEKSLLLVIASDGYVNSAGEDGTFIKAVKRSINASDMTLDKLFLLYRSTAYTSLSAYYQLANYYRDNGKQEKALTMSTLAALIAFTRMYEAVKERDMEYVYADRETDIYRQPNGAVLKNVSSSKKSNFVRYLEKVGEYYEIADWGARNGVWEGFYNYAQILYESDCKVLSEGMYSSLSQFCPEDFWRNLALSELLKIY